MIPNLKNIINRNKLNKILQKELDLIKKMDYTNLKE